MTFVRALQRLEGQTKKQGQELEKKAKQAAFLQVKASDYKVQAKKLNVRDTHQCCNMTAKYNTQLSLGFSCMFVFINIFRGFYNVSGWMGL